MWGNWGATLLLKSESTSKLNVKLKSTRLICMPQIKHVTPHTASVIVWKNICYRCENSISEF